MFDDGEGESEDRELYEKKLDRSTISSVHAKKSGPGRAWPPEHNTYCGVLSCPSSTGSCPDLWFFKLPVHSHDSQRRKQWLDKIKRPDMQPHHRILVCERHFDPQDICGGYIRITPKTKKYLKKGVIPSLHLPSANKIIHKNLHQTGPKHIYKRVYQEVNKTIDLEKPSTSTIECNNAFKKPKIPKGDLETTTTVKTEKNEQRTLLENEKGDLETTITVKTEKIEPNTLLENESTSTSSTGKAKHRVGCSQKEVEPAPTKTPRTTTKLELTEKEKRLCLSTLCNLGIGESLETFMKLKLKLVNESYDDNGKYSNEFKFLILDMYYANPQYYELLADMLNLPPPSALKSFIALNEKGLNRYGLQCLFAKLGPKQKQGMLCLEILKITPNVYYDYERDIINGVNEQGAPYQFAIIAMAQGISAEWNQILSVYFCHAINSITIQKYRSWTDEVMLSLEKIGIAIIALVTSTNDFFLQAYSIRETSIQHLSSKKHFFRQNGKKIWHIFDPLHLIMCLHDELQNNSFVFNDNCTVDWKHVKEFHLQEGLVNRSCTIPPESSQQDKLESAAAILLDRKTATGIYTFIEMEILNEEANHTAKFLMLLSEIFPIAMTQGMSASTNAGPSPNQTEPKKKKISCLINTKRMIISIMNKNMQFFENIKYTPESNEHKNGKVIKCLVSSFQSILAIYKMRNCEIKSYEEVSKIISTFNLNPLILFIDMIKLKYTKLTSELLLEAISESLIQNQCETKIDAFVEYADRLIELNEFHKEKPNMSLVMKDHRKLISDYSALSHDDGNSLMYVATYLLQKMDLHFRNVVSVKMKLMNSSVGYRNEVFSGTIIIPDDEFLELVIKMDSVFFDYCKMAMLTGKWFATLKEKILKVIVNVRYSGEAATLDFIGDLFIHLRIYHVLKYNKSMYEKNGEMHEFAVKRLEGYKLDIKKVKLADLECFRNPTKTLPSKKENT